MLLNFGQPVNGIVQTAFVVPDIQLAMQQWITDLNVGPWFLLPNFAGGGAERVALLLLAGLDRGTFQPHLAVLEASGPLRGLVPPNTVLHELAHPRLSRALPALVSLIRRLRPAVVFATQGYLNVALLAARRIPSKEIAQRLEVSRRTVDNHLHRVYSKIGVMGRDELAEALGITPD